MGRKPVDMINGNVMRSLIAFSIPALLSNFIQQAYSLTDSIIVGRVLGLNALAAIGVTMPIVFLLASLIFGVNNGVTILLSQSYGSGDIAEMRHAFFNSLYLGLVVSTAIASLGFFLTVPLLRLIGTPEELLTDAGNYVRISFFTTFCPMLYFLVFCAFRGMGDSMTALYCMIVSAVSNVFLDYLFIAVFHWGVAGSAWATALAQFMAMLLAMVLLFRKYPMIRPQKGDLKPDTVMFRRITGLAVPISLQTAFNNLGNIVAQSMVNLFGAVAMSAYTAGGRIGAFALLPLETIGSTLSVYSGQNYGAKKTERIHRGVRATLLLELIFSSVLGVLLILFGRQLSALFLEEPPKEMLQISFDYLLITGVPGLLAGLMFTYQQVLRGLGKVRDAMYGGFVQLGVKTAVILFSALTLHDLRAIWCAWPVSFAAGAVFVFLRYRRAKREIL